MRTEYYPLKKQRNEYGRLIRKDYESHRVAARRMEIKEIVPMFDGISRTITTVVTDNMILCVCEG